MRERKREKGSVAIKVYTFGGNNNIFADCILYCIYNYVGLLCFESAPYTKKFIDNKKVLHYSDIINSLLPRGKIYVHISFK